MMRYLGAFLLFCLSFAFSGQEASAGRGEIIVSAAMSLKNAFQEIGTAYARKNKGSKIVFNFGPSGGLVRQIESGAPVDVFASASPKEMDEIEKRGLTVPRSRLNFAANTLVLVVPRGVRRRAGSFSDLKSDAVRRIAAGDPKTVPAGRYADEVFRYYKLSDRIKGKLILAGNVRQVLDYIARGEVDAGVVYRSDVLSRPAEVEIVAEAPDSSHEPTLYPIAVVKGTEDEVAAEAFISLVVSAEGKRILEKYGFKAER